MTEKLKPCPFCKGEAVITHRIDTYCVRCKKCGCEATFFNNEKEVVDFWNNRPIEKEIDRLREALEHVATTDTTVDKYGIWRIDGKTFQTWAADVLKGGAE